MNKFFAVARLTYRSILKPQVVAIWLLLCVAVVVASPFGTYSYMDFGQRALYWSTVVTLSFVLGFGGRALAVYLCPAHSDITRFVVEGVFATLFISVAVWGLGRVPFFGPEVRLVPFYLTLSYVALVSGAVVTIRAFVMLATGMKSAAVERVRPRLADRLNGEAAPWILHLSVTDHSVDVTTDKGQERVRMRLTDAIREMEGVEGFRVHRSHWVARDAIRCCEMQQGRCFLILVNGTRVPVSRNYRPMLEEAGIF